MLEGFRAAADEEMADIVANEAMRVRFLAVCGTQSIIPKRPNGALSSSLTAIVALGVMVVLLLSSPAPYDATTESAGSMLELLAEQALQLTRGASAPAEAQNPLPASGDAAPIEAASAAQAGDTVASADTSGTSANGLQTQTLDHATERAWVAPIPSMLAQPLYPVMSAGKYGYMDAAGTIKVDTRYDFADFFGTRGYAKAGLAEAGRLRYALVFDDATYTECQYYAIKDFDAQGVAAALDVETELWGFINESGQWIVAPAFDLADSYDNDRASVVYQQAEGSIDREGVFSSLEEVALPAEEAAATPAPPTEALDELSVHPVASDGDRWIYATQSTPPLLGAMAANGEIIVPAMYPFLAFIEDAGYLYGVTSGTGQMLYGVLSPAGAATAPHAYIHLSPCPGGYALNAQPAGTDRFGLLSYAGEQLLPPQYASILYFDGTLALIEAFDEQGRRVKGYVDAQGSWVRIEN